jgi:hypothetical protein
MITSGHIDCHRGLYVVAIVDRSPSISLGAFRAISNFFSDCPLPAVVTLSQIAALQSAHVADYQESRFHGSIHERAFASRPSEDRDETSRRRLSSRIKVG